MTDLMHLDLLPFLIAFAPLLFAVTRGRGGDGWKIATGLLCLLAPVGVFFGLLPGLIAWIAAWCTAAAASSAARNLAMQEKIHAAIEANRRAN